MQRTEYAVNSHCFNSVLFKAKMSCQNMATLYTPTCSNCSERFPGPLSPKSNECLHFDLESCNLMCIYTVVTDPCHIPPLAQARPMMLCIYTSSYVLSFCLHCHIVLIATNCFDSVKVA